MLRCSKFLTLLLLLSPAIGFARGVPNGESPALTPVPELSAGFDLLYEQKFAEARQIFANWESRNREDPFGEVAVAASYLFASSGKSVGNWRAQRCGSLRNRWSLRHVASRECCSSSEPLWISGPPSA